MSDDAATQQNTDGNSPFRLGARNKTAQDRAAIARVKLWVRDRFRLNGCPPLETVIAFWTDDGQRRHYKVFKPVVDVVEDDLPPSWMKNALIVQDGMGCDCC
jgi:nitrate reductase delta subunit